MKDLSTILQRTLNEASTKIKEEVVKLPMIERDARIAEMKKRFGASRFKRSEPEDFMKSESEGFFFHYNPTAKKYYESNASIQFMFFKVSNSRELSSPPDIDEYWNHFNFKVDRLEKTITPEKQWSGTKLHAPVIEKPSAYQTALRIAIKRHPEISDYKVVGISDIKSVDDIMDLASEDMVGKDKDFFVFYGNSVTTIAKMLESGINDPIRTDFTYSAALARARMSNEDDPDGAWAVIKLKVNGKDNIRIKSSSIEIDEQYDPEDITLVKASTSNAFEKANARKKFDRYEEIWQPYFSEIIITSKDDIEALGRIHSLSGKERKMRTPRIPLYKSKIIDGYYKLTTKSNTRILLLDQDIYSSDRKIKDALLPTVLNQQLWWHQSNSKNLGLTSDLIKTLTSLNSERNLELAREWVYENNPPSEVSQGVIKSLLAPGSFNDKKYIIEFLQKSMPLANIEVAK